MKMRMVFVLACLGSLILITNAYGQAGQRNPGDPPFVSRYPCPGGAEMPMIDSLVSEPTDVEGLSQSELVIKGTVVRVLPSEVIGTNGHGNMYTTSLISIDEVLHG